MRPSKIPELRLSVVVVTNTGLRALFPIIGALKKQTIAPSIELIIVGPQLDQSELQACCEGAFGSAQSLSIGPIQNRGRAAAHGVVLASTPIVALTENHCFPVHDWAERLLEAYADGPSGVGPSVINANPHPLSWAMFALGYGAFAPTMHAEMRDALPLHNSSYRTSALQRLSNQLPELLADERNLISALRASGAKLWFEPKAVTRHINECTWTLVTTVAFCNAWRYASLRRKSWPLWRRCLYAACWPLLSLPIARNFFRTLKNRKDTPTVGVELGAYIWFIALFHAAGEAFGYILQPPSAFPSVDREEFFITERLGASQIQDPEIRELLALLGQETIDEGGVRAAADYSAC